MTVQDTNIPQSEHLDEQMRTIRGLTVSLGNDILLFQHYSFDFDPQDSLKPH